MKHSLFYCLLFLSLILVAEQPPFLTTKTPWAYAALQKMTLRQKIGQLFVVAAASNFNQPTELLASSFFTSPYRMDKEYVEYLIREYHVGGIIFLYKSDPETQRSFIDSFQQLSTVPLLITQDCEWGLSMRLYNKPNTVIQYPRNMTLGALDNDQLIYDLGREIGKQCAMIGVHMNFAPVIDVNNNPKNPVIHDRSFGDDPEHVARCGELYMRGLQDAGVLACAKHFPGHGDTDTDSHHKLPSIMHDIQRLEAIELFPFKHLINKGVAGVMTAHIIVPALDKPPYKPASLSSAITTDYLRNRLNFRGLIITDGLGMRAVADSYKPGKLEHEAFCAGNDILLCPLDVPMAVDLIEQDILAGTISEAELDRRVLKILQAKEWVFSQHKQYSTLSNSTQFLIRPEAKQLAQLLYEQALTVAKKGNNNFRPELLADSIIIHSTKMINNAFISDINIHHSALHLTNSIDDHRIFIKNYIEPSNKNTVIIAIGNMNKDINNNFGISNEIQALIGALKQQKKNVIVILFGTPYSIPLVTNADTIIVAYEETEHMQRAAAKLLQGTLKASGRLPITI